MEHSAKAKNTQNQVQISDIDIRETIHELQNRFQGWFMEFDSLEDWFRHYLSQKELHKIKDTLCHCRCCERHFMDLKGDKEAKKNNELCACHCRQYRRMCERVLSKGHYWQQISNEGSISESI